MDIPSFVTTLVSSPPKPPHSVDLVIDTEGDSVGLFEALLSILIEMLKKWYPTPIQLSRVSESDFVKVSQYFASFGMSVIVNVEQEPRVLRINNKEYEHQTHIDQMKFQMTSGGKLYTVKFGFV
jgi:hypothetical protein